jgi:hypothetical protein
MMVCPVRLGVEGFAFCSLLVEMNGLCASGAAGIALSLTCTVAAAA